MEGALEKMTEGEKFDYWLDIAQYDLETAGAMFQSGRWLYVIFMCQQAIEKLVKGLYLLYIDDIVPRTHNISNLLLRFSDKLPEAVSDARYQLFERLSNYYLESRYPEYIVKLSEMTNSDTAKSMLDQSREAFQWLLTLKP
jgi:HEPN domain-containing protein